MMDDHSELIEYLDKKFISVDERLKTVDGKFLEVGKQLGNIDARFDQVDKRFDELQGQFSELQTSVDSYVKRAEAYFQEMTMLAHKVDRHEKWIQQLADKLGFKLDY